MHHATEGCYGHTFSLARCRRHTKAMGTDMFLFISAVSLEGSSLHIELKFSLPAAAPLSVCSTPLGTLWEGEGRGRAAINSFILAMYVVNRHAKV